MKSVSSRIVTVGISRNGRPLLSSTSSMITPMPARIAAAISGEIDSDVSPGIDSDGIEVRGASVVVVTATDVVVVSPATVDDVDSPDESHAAATSANVITIATSGAYVRNWRVLSTSGRVPRHSDKRCHKGLG